jgi:hypothetical protein
MGGCIQDPEDVRTVWDVLEESVVRPTTFNEKDKPHTLAGFSECRVCQQRAQPFSKVHGVIESTRTPNAVTNARLDMCITMLGAAHPGYDIGAHVYTWDDAAGRGMVRVHVFLRRGG